jgi:hypothetical protein
MSAPDFKLPFANGIDLLVEKVDGGFWITLGNAYTCESRSMTVEEARLLAFYLLAETPP